MPKAPDPARDVVRFQQLGNNLSALSFLVDMLNYQPLLAKKLFVFDEAAGELRPLMGRVATALPSAGAESEAVAIAEPVAQVPVHPPEPQPVAVEPAEPLPSSPPVAAAGTAVDEDDDDEDLRSIFLEEAREVVVNGNEAVRQLQAQPDDLAQLTTLRRAFHTLKGSSRMVGLSAYGEAAWAMEQLFNAVLAEQRPASAELLSLAHQSLAAFSRWADSIEAKSDLLVACPALHRKRPGVARANRRCAVGRARCRRGATLGCLGGARRDRGRG